MQVEPDYWEKIYLMLPNGADLSKALPVVIVPFYDVDTAAGKNLGGRRTNPLGTRSYGYLAVQQGMAAVAIRWYGESYGENSAEVVANLKARHPRVTGLGKWVWDSQRLLDYLSTRPELDMARAGMIGHSLGGKMTLYAAAMMSASAPRSVPSRESDSVSPTTMTSGTWARTSPNSLLARTSTSCWR
ncbi:MAG: hypothetical protein M3Z09_14375 [Acidobacteriota bacterium]|nr:hypothetical protein [Acidobacteriota bacterium]